MTAADEARREWKRNGVPMEDRRAAEAEHAVDRLRSRFGRNAVVKGLALDDD